MLNNKKSLFPVTIIYKNNKKCKKCRDFLTLKPFVVYHIETIVISMINPSLIN
jgi:hypothetical protein